MSLPSYDRLKALAKILLQQARSGSPGALERLRKAGISGTPKHADCLHVVAVEHGFRSWPRLKLYLQSLGMTRDQRLRELEACLFEGRPHVMDKLLEIDPGLAHAHLGIELAMLDAAAAVARLDTESFAATRAIGSRTPLLHLAFSRYAAATDEGRATSVELAKLLLDRGADPNEWFAPADSPESRLSALYGALCHAGNLPLAELLLTRGAEPNDNESLYHATELPHARGIELLYRYKARTAGTNALYRVLDRENIEGLSVMLANGADPNEPLGGGGPCGEGKSGNTLHHAVRRMRSAEVLLMLLDAGANPAGTFCGHGLYALSRIYGNLEAAGVLNARGLAAELGPTEAYVTAVVDGDESAALSLIRRHRGLKRRLDRLERTIHTELAGMSGQGSKLRRLHSAGFDPNLVGDSGMSAPHFCAWRGDAETLSFYLEQGVVDLEAKNRYGGTLLGTAVHGSANCPADIAVDYPATVRLILEAGARILPDAEHLTMGSQEVMEILEANLGA